MVRKKLSPELRRGIRRCASYVQRDIITRARFGETFSWFDFARFDEEFHNADDYPGAQADAVKAICGIFQRAGFNVEASDVSVLISWRTL